MPKIENLDQAPGADEESVFFVNLRPQKLSEYIGQNIIRENLSIAIKAAGMRNEPLEHTLIAGPPGLGKTTLANIIAKEMGAEMHTTSGPAIERTGDLASIITNLNNGDVLFIDEVHRLNRTIEEMLYSALEDFALDLVLGKGPGARSVRLDLPRFTLVGATTKPGALSGALRDRFGLNFRLDYYQPEEIEKIIHRSAQILNISIEEEGVKVIAERARRTPRVANKLLRRVRDFVQVKGNGKITREGAHKALDTLAVDTLGLDENDRKILITMVEKFKGGPVGLESLAAACMEDQVTLTDVHEPYLMQIGFIKRTPKGRMITDSALNHLGMEASEQKLWT